MKKETYLENRNKLMAEAQAALDASDMETFNAKSKEIETLDSQYDSEAKAQANLNALMNRGAVHQPLEGAKNVVGAVIGSTGEAGSMDIFDSAEYRRAFQDYVCKGSAIPAQFVNSDANTKTSDAGVTIPSETVQKIYQAMEKIGVILPLVTKTFYPGGVSVPTSTAKPTATWVAEGAGSDKQKKAVGSLTFSYFKLRCAVSMSYEMAKMAYPFFEAQFVKDVSDAIVKAQELAILSGTGVGQPKGVLLETAAANVDVAEGSHVTYANLMTLEGTEEDDNAVWIMTKKTYMSEFEGMVDSQGQPVARVNYGLAGKPEYTIQGRKVVITPPSYMTSWGAITADSIIAAMYNFSDYIFNSAAALTTKWYTDEDTDDEILKAIALCDGKSVLNESLVTLTLKNS